MKMKDLSREFAMIIGAIILSVIVGLAPLSLIPVIGPVVILIFYGMARQRLTKTKIDFETADGKKIFITLILISVIVLAWLSLLMLIIVAIVLPIMVLALLTFPDMINLYINQYTSTQSIPMYVITLWGIALTVVVWINLIIMIIGMGMITGRIKKLKRRR